MSDPRQDFKRSQRFGLFGVAAVAVVTAAIALLFGQGDPNPTAVYIAIFVIIFGFVGTLLYLQRRDTDVAEAKSKLAATGPITVVTDPTAADPRSLLADLAVSPIDARAIDEASGRTWGLVRGSINSGAILMVLIFCAVVPWQLFRFYWSLYVFVPIIVIYASFLTARLLGPGGSLGPLYEDAAPTMKPLGLTLVEAPRVKIRRRAVGPGSDAQIVGAAAYEGERHGRPVSLRIAKGSTTTLGGEFAPFTVAAKGERLSATARAPAAVTAVIEPLVASEIWKGVSIKGGPAGIVVERKQGAQHWMCDLWLAERLAAASAHA